jgi:hypothetical protein
MVLLPLLAGWLLYRMYRHAYGPLDAFRRSAVLWGVALLAMTELLSRVHLLTPIGVAVGWAVASAVLALLLWRVRGRPTVPAEAVPATWAIVLPVGITLAATLVIGLVAAPNSTEGLIYHLARIDQWIQRGSIEPYATSTTRQLFMPPWTELAILHVRLLSGGSDRFSALVPWFAFAGCLAMGYGIARQLGAGREGAGLAALVIASLPMAVLEASSTQVDLPLAFWALTLAAFTLDGTPQRPWSDILLAGAALGLALASKSTAYVICAPFCVWWLVGRVRSGGMRRALAETATVGGLALLLCLPFYARNLRVFGHPLGPAGTAAAYGNESHGLGTLTSNLVRNSTLHLGTPFGLWNDGLTLAVVRAHQALGLNPQDPRTTWFEDTRYQVWPLSTYEGRTGNLLHFLLVLATGGLLLLRPQPRLSRWYGLAVLAGAVLFCWVLKWQHWHGRLHTPLFILAAPLLAVTLERAMPGRRALGVGLLLWLGSLPWLLASEMRPLLTLPRWHMRSIFAVPREQQYLVNQPDLEAPYVRAAVDLARLGCHDVALAATEDTWSHPIIAFARMHGVQIRVHYVFVENESRALERRPAACALLEVDREPGWTPGPPYSDQVLRWRMPRVALWLPPALSVR